MSASGSVETSPQSPPGAEGDRKDPEPVVGAEWGDSLTGSLGSVRRSLRWPLEQGTAALDLGDVGHVLVAAAAQTDDERPLATIRSSFPQRMRDRVRRLEG